MKNDELLYEYIDELTGEETMLLDDMILLKEHVDEMSGVSSVQSREEENTWKRQENLIMDKIRTEIKASRAEVNKKNTKRETHSDMLEQVTKPVSKCRLFGKHKAVVLVAAFVLVLGMVGFAKERDWDIEMADMLGLSAVMEELDGGYVKIGASDKSDGITITATQGIGDKNSMWVQLDTDLSWDVGEDGYYVFEVSDGHWYKGTNFLTGGHQMYSYNNNGKVSFIWYFMGYEDINRARNEVYLSEIRAYETLEDEDEGYIVSTGSWEFEWENCYAPNTVVVRPYKTVTMQSERSSNTMDCFVTEIEISPVSMWAVAWKSPFERFETSDDIVYLSVDSITLTDGTTIMLDNGFTTAGTNNFQADCFLNFDDLQSVNVDEIDYITMGGEDIQVAR
ncbi:MAG: hypothetical protein IJP29_08490 [Lachnospiraceae bacterium]|nr:hypothetical protein [Lachnospiraceae bacterium]